MSQRHAWVRRDNVFLFGDMVGQDFQQPPELPSENLRAGELKSAPKFLSFTSGKYLGAKSFIQFTDKFLDSFFSVGDKAQSVTWLSQVESNS